MLAVFSFCIYGKEMDCSSLAVPLLTNYLLLPPMLCCHRAKVRRMLPFSGNTGSYFSSPMLSSMCPLCSELLHLVPLGKTLEELGLHTSLINTMLACMFLASVV